MLVIFIKRHQYKACLRNINTLNKMSKFFGAALIPDPFPSSPPPPVTALATGFTTVSAMLFLYFTCTMLYHIEFFSHRVSHLLTELP